MQRQAPGAAVPCSGPRPADPCMLADPAPAAGPCAEAAAAFGRVPGLECAVKGSPTLRVGVATPPAISAGLQAPPVLAPPRVASARTLPAARPAALGYPAIRAHRAPFPSAWIARSRLGSRQQPRRMRAFRPSGSPGSCPARTPWQPPHMMRSVLPLPPPAQPSQSGVGCLRSAV